MPVPPVEICDELFSNFLQLRDDSKQTRLPSEWGEVDAIIREYDLPSEPSFSSTCQLPLFKHGHQGLQLFRLLAVVEQSFEPEYYVGCVTVGSDENNEIVKKCAKYRDSIDEPIPRVESTEIWDRTPVLLIPLNDQPSSDVQQDPIVALFYNRSHVPRMMSVVEVFGVVSPVPHVSFNGQSLTRFHVIHSRPMHAIVDQTIPEIDVSEGRESLLTELKRILEDRDIAEILLLLLVWCVAPSDPSLAGKVASWDFLGCNINLICCDISTGECICSLLHQLLQDVLPRYSFVSLEGLETLAAEQKFNKPSDSHLTETLPGEEEDFNSEAYLSPGVLQGPPHRAVLIKELSALGPVSCQLQDELKDVLIEKQVLFICPDYRFNMKMLQSPIILISLRPIEGCDTATEHFIPIKFTKQLPPPQTRQQSHQHILQASRFLRRMATTKPPIGLQTTDELPLARMTQSYVDERSSDSSVTDTHLQRWLAFCRLSAFSWGRELCTEHDWATALRLEKKTR